MSRPTNTKVRRAQIVKGLMTAMAKHGYDGASIQNIAKESKLTSGLIHYHFKSKIEILVALVQHLTELANSRLKTISHSTDSPIKQLTAIVDTYLATGEGANSTAVAAWVVIGTEAIKQKEVRAVYKNAIKSRFHEIKVSVIKTLESEGKATENAAKLAAGIVSIIEGAFQISSSASNIFPKEYAATITKRMVEGFIFREADSKNRIKKRESPDSILR
jgi:TetR/AcrR family transcriptional repressor of bet genes